MNRFQGLLGPTPEARRRTWTIVSIVAGAVIIWVLFQAIQASVALNRAAGQAQVLKQELAQGDTEGARDALARLTANATKAQDNSNGPLWTAMSWIPLLGPNAEALTEMSAVLADVTTGALPPMVDIAEDVKADTFAPEDGQVDIGAMKRVAPQLTEAAEILTKADARLDEIDPGRLLGRFRRPVEELKLAVSTGSEAANAAAQVSAIAPAMLGEDNRTRRYLLLFQSNAEVRSLGGVPGSWAIIEAKNGKVEMTVQGDGGDVGPRQYVGPLTDDEKTVFSDVLVNDWRDTTMTPDFPRAGQLAKSMLAKGVSEKVDGVIAVDPVALGYMLAGTGPIRVSSGGTFDHNNAAFLLLNKAYALLRDAQQDDFFQEVARAAFDAVSSGKGDSQRLLRGLVKGASENRILVWSAHASEQKRIATTGVSGVLTGDDGKTPHVGLYLNDATETKLQYYLDFNTRAQTTSCEDGVQTIETSTTFSSAAPPDAAELPLTVTGRGTLAPKGSMRVNLRFYAPFGGSIESVKVDGKSKSIYSAQHKGRPVTLVSLLLAPSDRFTVTTRMHTGKGQTGDGVLSSTPGIASTPNDVVFASAC